MESPGISLEGEAWIDDLRIFPSLKLSLQPGEWTSLLGVSGVGKTTLLRLIAGIETASAFTGQISTTDNLPLDGRIAFMGQSDLLAPWLDVLGNVTIGARLRGEAREAARAIALIERVGLRDHVRSLPHMLSGGQRQRAALARTLMEDRPVVLLDEPFSALDARTRAEMQELAGELLAGKTVLLVTHEPGEAARLSHKAWLMDEAGLSELVLPATDPVRPYDEAEVIAAQTTMFRRLRGIA
jgi:putative hydroxymethylpyrimidine transport system ATP-binding protein